MERLREACLLMGQRWKRGSSRHTEQANVLRSPRSSGDTRIPGGARPTWAPQRRCMTGEPGSPSLPAEKQEVKAKQNCRLTAVFSEILAQDRTEELPLSSLGVCVNTDPASPPADSWSTGLGRGKVTTRPSWQERKINAETRKKPRTAYSKQS